MREEASYREFRALAPVLFRGRLRIWAAALSVALLRGPALPADDALPADVRPDLDASPVDLKELPLLWRAQRAEIATAEIHFRCFSSSFENPQNTPEHVAQLLAMHDLAAQPDQLEVFLTAFTGRTFGDRKPWDDMVLTLSGSRRRVDGRYCQFVTDGDLEAVFTPVNRQLDLQPVGKSTVRHYRLQDLRWIPAQRVSTAAWEYRGAQNGTAVFNVPPAADGPDFEVVTALDPATGIVMHSITRYSDGAPAIEMYQFGLDLHASGVLFPRLRIDLTYSRGAVYTAQIMLVQRATFNEPIAEDAFDLSAPAGARVVDHRIADKDVWIASAEIPDALAVQVRPTSPAEGAIGAIARPAGAGRWWWLIAGVHLVGASAAVVLLWRRRRAMPSRSSSSPN